jgi:hypothetical protein
LSPSGEEETAGVRLAVCGEATMVRIAQMHRTRMEAMHVAKEAPETRRSGAWNGAG